MRISSFLSFALVVGAAAVSGCGPGLAGARPDAGPGPDAGPDIVGNDLCDVKVIFENECIACHDGSTFPDLRAAALPSLIGLASEQHPDRTLVVAGDPAASYLFTKIDAVTAADGDLMPVGGELSANAKETVRAWIAGGAGTSCDVVGEGEGEVAEGEGEPATSACAVLSTSCARCHNGGSIDVDLRPDAQQALVGAASPGYPGKTLVVAGDPDGSFLFQKMAGTQGAGGRGIMPPGGAVSAADLALVRQWIADGAADDCNGVDPPPPPQPLVPGGDISGHIAAPSLIAGFTDNVPSGVSGTCSTNQYWQFGDSESEKMHPGYACLECHRSEHEGPQRGFLGTVQQNLTDSDDCRGVKDIKVDILDDIDGSVMATTTTNSAGNFIIESALCTGATCPPYRVRLTLDGRTREMLSPQTNGDCMSCHTAAGLESAPGRIVSP